MSVVQPDSQSLDGNYAENHVNFLILLGVAGLRYPLYSAIAGAVYLAGRIVYAVGYCSGNPSKRLQGSFGYLGLIACLGMSLTTIVQMIREV